MGKGKKRRKVSGDAPVEDNSEDEGEISVEEADIGDIEALARQSLNPGETILGEGKTEAEVETRGICNAPLILQKMEDIEYKVPSGAKRVPWVDTLSIDGWRTVAKDIKAKDGVKLEGAFIDLANDAVKEAYRRLKVMKVPSSRPTDFYAEMLRTDQQMFKVRERAVEEQRRIKIVETRKKAQSAKKFAKSVKVKKLESKAGEKRKTLEEIADWRNQRKKDKSSADDQDLEDILDKQGGKGEGKRKKDKKVSAKQAAKDAKFGRGGKKKRRKQNTSDSFSDMSSSPWAKGKGKGKGKGGKGGGKGGKGGGKGKGKGKRR